jgi:ketosteroid isomerase-like protein
MKINVMRSIAAGVFLCMMSNIGMAEQRKRGTIQSLVEAEKAFAAMASEKGFRDSFLANFTEEGIAFTPAPGRSNEALRKLPPPPPGPPKNKLKWHPDFSDISAAGDLGYNTGPFWVEGPGGKDLGQNQGYFFSLWRMQPDGNWKVVLDIGARASLPDAQRVLPWKQATTKGYSPKKNEARDQQIAHLRATEVAGQSWSLEHYESVLATESRFHTDGALPVLGAKQILDRFRTQAMSNIVFEAMFADVADSNDLGYTYGSYALQGASSSEKGYYTHVWKRNPKGKWELTAEIRSPLPTEEANK